MASQVHVPLNVLDHFCPPNYTAISWYIPLRDGVTPQEAFAALQDGLRLTFRQLPWLSGKVYRQRPSTPGWRPGQLEVRHDDVAETAGDEDIATPQFHFKQWDTTQVPMSYDEITECGFPMDTFADADVLWGEYINVPGEEHGAECFKAQANFLPGAVLLCGATHHNVCDGTGQFDVWRLWAANCEALQSGAVPAAPGPLSSDRGLLDRIWRAEGGDPDKPSSAMKPAAWKLLDLDMPGQAKAPAPALSFDETMQSAVFYVSDDSFSALYQRCVDEAGAGAPISRNDALTALIWRGLLKARRSAALQAGRASKGEMATADARLQLTLDGRPDISRVGAMPLVYLGNLVLMNLCTLPLATLTADNGLGPVARAIRRVADEATPEAMLDAYALAHRVDDLAALGLRLTPLRGHDLILSSLLMFPVDEMRWGSRVFARQGRPDALRPLWDAINTAARLCFPLPRRAGAGVEFVVNLFPDEMALLMGDKEFGEYAFYTSS